MIDRILADSEDFHEIAPKNSTIEGILREKFDLFVIGQDKAKDALITSVMTNLNSIIHKKGVLGCFLFTGPTGVGKTEMVHALASMLLGHPDRITKIRGEHFQQDHTITNLVGSPKSYVGYNDAPILANIYKPYEEAKQKGEISALLRLFLKFNIILLDEVEKMNPKIHQAFLGIMDDGVIQLTNGETIDFGTSIIIMTSNIGARERAELEKKPAMGFVERDKEKERAEIDKESFRMFSPEFMGRVDSVIDFEYLNHEDCKKIIELKVNAINARFEQWADATPCTRLELLLDENAYVELIKRGYSKEKGARELNRVFNREINSKLGQILNQNPELLDFHDYKVTIICSYTDRFVFGIRKHNIEKLVKDTKDNVVKLLPKD